MQKEGGPIKTSFEFSKSTAYQIIGLVTEPKPHQSFNDTFKMDVLEFSKQVIFQQKIKLKASQITVKGKLNFMVCDDHQCLPPEDVDFSIPIK